MSRITVGFSPSSSRYYALASKLFPPISRRNLRSDTPLTSPSQRSMLENGLIDYGSGAGFFNLLPMATRSLEKLYRIICEEMDSIGGQKVQLPSICDRGLLEKTGRLSAFGDDLFKLQDRLGEQFILTPTHEESITDLVANRLAEMSPTSAPPLLLYQITSKFRDEMKPRFGLLRGREFLMKDMYSFDMQESDATKTYETCLRAYERILRDRLGPLRKPLYRVASDVGAMGGSISHEFHFECKSGEDEIHYCDRCGKGVNRELIRCGGEKTTCHDCNSARNTLRTVEIAHAFLLGTKYSEALNAYFVAPDGRKPAYMGCYGIGVTRLLAALIECNLSPTKQHLRWPVSIAPYTVCVIPPKAGSKEEAAGADRFAIDCVQGLINIDDLMKGEVLFDDRTDMTVGRRLLDAKRLGFPFIIVSNKSAVKESIPRLELIDLTVENADEENTELVTHEALFSRVRELRKRMKIE